MATAKLSGTLRRVFGALLLGPFVFAMWYDQTIGGVVLCCLALLMGLEAKRITKMPYAVGYFLVGLSLAQAVPHWIIIRPSAVVIAIAFLGALIVFFYTNRLVAVFIGLLLLCLGYAGFLLSQPTGHIILIALAAIIAVCDITAYFVGRRVGGPKLWSQVSPNKTISGSVGGLVGTIMLTFLLADIFGFKSHSESLIAGFFLGILAQTGDLLESAIKRRLNIKDSGSILPGHGGVLDRFDGYILVVPVSYFYLFGI